MAKSSEDASVCASQFPTHTAHTSFVQLDDTTLMPFSLSGWWFGSNLIYLNLTHKGTHSSCT